MVKQILTLDNLYQFFVEQNKSVNFNSTETKTPIVVSVPGYFEAAQDEMTGMLKLKLKVCHVGTNRNGSHISTENMEKALPTLKYRPVLAYIHDLPNGDKDFFAHNVEFIEQDDGETEVVYLEKQVGCFTVDTPWLEYDKEADKTYVMAYAVVPEEYTEAADIIRRKNGTKVSCELVINELTYNAKEKFLDIVDFYFSATTLLGCDEEGNEIGEGMLGSRADINDFCFKQPVLTYQDRVIEMLDKLNTTLSNFNKDIDKKGGDTVMTKFEELLAKYGVTAEDITFEYEGLSDEELEKVFSEAFDVVDGGDGEEPPVTENFTKTFTIELSHDDIRHALYTLIAQYDTEDKCHYIREVYDNYFVMQEWWDGKLYKQNYTVDGENVTLEGERVEVFEILVTQEEREALDALKSNYAELEGKYNELKQFKDDYDAEKAKVDRDTVLNSVEYDEIRETESFKDLVSEADTYTAEELSVKADLLFAAFKKTQLNFERQQDAKSHSVGIPINTKADKKTEAYSGLFDED